MYNNVYYIMLYNTRIYKCIHIHIYKVEFSINDPSGISLFKVSTQCSVESYLVLC